MTDFKFKKLHITVPEELFEDIKMLGLFPTIDERMIPIIAKMVKEVKDNK